MLPKGLVFVSIFNLREFACLTTVILASDAETLGSEQPVVHHFRFIRFIVLRSPGGSESV